MPSFGKTSKERLSTCHPQIQRVMHLVVRDLDCSIVTGYRNQKDQNSMFERGLSKLQYPNGKHNKMPSEAVDVAPYPIDWNDTKRFYFFAGFVIAKAKGLGINLRWGGDWDGDNDFNDQNFNDLIHFELRKP